MRGTISQGLSFLPITVLAWDTYKDFGQRLMNNDCRVLRGLKVGHTLDKIIFKLQKFIIVFFLKILRAILVI